MTCTPSAVSGVPNNALLTDEGLATLGPRAT